jgi:tetratricopeptide (TPR) repeat protein
MLVPYPTDNSEAWKSIATEPPLPSQATKPPPLDELPVRMEPSAGMRFAKLTLMDFLAPKSAAGMWLIIGVVILFILCILGACILVSHRRPAYREHPALDNPQYRSHLGSGHDAHATGDLDKAVSEFTEAIRIDPTCPHAFSGLGHAFMAKREFEKAIIAFNGAMRLDPEKAWLLVWRGEAWVSLEEYDLAITDLTEAIRQAPLLDRAYLYRGKAWRLKKEYDKAIADLSEAIHLDPDPNLDAYVQRGWTWSAKGRYEMAIDDFNQVIREYPWYGPAYTGRAHAWRAMGRMAEATADESKAAARFAPK